MDITKKVNGKTTTLFIVGSLESTTSHQLEEEINNVLPSCNKLILDFKKISYVSSAGLRVLLIAQKQCKIKKIDMQIINANDIVKEVFQLTGFVSVVNLG